ncbi:uncharacterized protein LOC122255943 [Penaeus japonicus]|uniref:uncharacterized protein LOC122255943 n=1 Tax=Penaeus japonicus TaxID=27405 RepID=UPI001C716C60|nr:uncharacterized protein LOC122255943 [Penaeus japonicus]
MGLRRLLCVLATVAVLQAGDASVRNVIDDQIIAALESFRNHMIDGWPELGIPPLDPLVLPEVRINVTSGTTHLHGSLTNLTINKMSTFTIDRVQSNILFFKVDVSLGLPMLDFAGNYDVGGAIDVLPIYGSGPFWMDAFDLQMSITIKLGEAEGGLGVSTLDLNFEANSTDIHFENIMGGGDMEDFVNGVLSSLGPDILQALEDVYEPWLEEALRKEINDILHGSERASKDETVNDFFDLLFANMRQSIIENGQDPLSLPSDSDNFTVSLFNTTMDGEVAVSGGHLAGLSTVHRAGNMTLLYVGEQDEVIWGGEVGLIDLEADYTFGLTLALFGKDLELSLKMSYVHLSFETDVFLHQSNVTFAHCNVTELGPLHFKEKGAGPLDTPLYNILANTLLGELAGLVTSAVEGAICSLLEGAFGSS